MNETPVCDGDAGRPGAEPSDRIERLAARHRARFLRPLCAGRSVLIEGGDGAAPLVAAAASVVGPATPQRHAEVVLALDPVAPAMAVEALPRLAKALREGGVLVLVCRQGGAPDSGPPDPGPDVVRAALARRFRHVATFRQRPLAGTLVADARFDGSRVVALADAPAHRPGVTLYLASAAPLPDLVGGLFEAPLDLADALADASPAANPAANESPGYAIPGRLTIANPVDLPEETVRDQSALDLRRRAVSLVERLLDRDDLVLSLRGQATRLQRALDDRSVTGAAAGGGAFDVPRTRHDWPLADNPEAGRTGFGSYDHRVDDEVLLEGRAGEGFLAQIAGDDAASLADAIARLEARPRTLRLVAADAEPPPDVSIVIPVYGQLAYTLNCLDSLFAHRSRCRAEIIVIDDVSPDATGDLLPRLSGIRYHRQPANGGFIESCNTGAAMARGRYVVMLNNDTRLVAGWLDELIGAFTLFPRAGLVGSKLLYPDGVLQEAGGIIWRDGSGWNYGRNDDPNRPQYCHARQVDYISGASIALPAELWRELGGFDAHYRPAYCEDADLCLRVRAQGREVWLQPQSRIIHYEGRTSGTDTGQGVKAYQVVNTKKLFLRWRDRLERHRPNGEAPYFERERGVRRRMLVVDATAPTPNQDAGSVQTVLALRIGQALGYKVHFVPEDNFLFQPRYTTDLLRMGVDCAYAPYEIGFENYLRRYGRLFDVVLAYRVSVLEKIHDIVRAHAPAAPLIYHVADLHFLRMRREAALEHDAAKAERAEAMRAREFAMVARCDCTITHSRMEARVLNADVPAAPVQVWPLMFDFFGTGATFADRRDICFLGGYRHPPNVDAVVYFVERIFPILRRAEPGIRFIIAGANPSPEVRALACNDIVVTGLVEDLRDVFDVARVFVCPLRVGAGVKGKVASAMAYGIPVVTTAIGAEGVDFVPGEHLLIEDDPEDFARATLRLYRDRALWDRLSRQSQAYLRDHLSPAMGQRVFAEAIEAAFAHKLGLGVPKA